MTLDFLIETYETERLKTLSVWSAFTDEDMEFRPAPRTRTPHEHMVHQCLSEDNWFKNMLGIDVAMAPVPAPETRFDFMRHYATATGHRLVALREKPEEWFGETAQFFNVERSRAWIFVRRLTHSAHHRAQLTVYLRLLGRPVYSTYGPSADTGGLPVNKAPTIYRYSDIDDLLTKEATGGESREVPGPIGDPTERPTATPVRRSLERVVVRTRDNTIARGAWRAVTDASGGSGAITLLDEGFFRGEGVFNGWTQEQLAAEYARLTPPVDEPPFQVPMPG
jgi:uncharacterized damage-inducible protein DinB